MDSVLMVNKVLKLDKSSWKLAKLGDLAKDISKRVDNPGESEYDRFVGLGNFVSGDIKIKTWETTKNLASSAKAFQVGDILFARRNAYLRRASLVDFDGCCSGDAFVLRENHDKVIPGFLAFFMNSNALWDFANSNAAGTMSKRVKWRDLANYEFLLPPIDQQSQLAELLWAMDEVIEGYWNTKVALNKYKKRVSYDCFYSNEVEKINLEKLTNKIQDGSHFSPKKIYSKNDGSRYRYVTSKNIRVTGIEFKEDQYVDKDFHDSIYPRCDVKKGDLLLTKDGASTGAATLNTLEDEFSLLSSVCLIRSNDKTTNEYLYHYINSDMGNYDLINQMTGTAITRLTLTTLRKIKIPVPVIEKQLAVVTELNTVDTATDDLLKSIEKSKSLQKSLINQVF
jgi:type I restriction enzyme, S subunit